MKYSVRTLHIAIAVTDMEKSVAFYETLGFIKKQEREVDPQWIGANYDLYHLENGVQCKITELSASDGTELELFSFNPMKASEVIPWDRTGIIHFCLQADNLDEMCADSMKMGGSIALKPVIGKQQGFAFIRDPDGNLIEVIWKKPETDK